MLARALALALLLAGTASAEVPVPALSARVTDLTGTLTAPQIQTLEARLRDFERSKGSQITVLMLPTTQPETIEQYSIRVAEAWKIGRARIDDGVILVVAKNDRKLRIEVGRGLEGAIPDAIAKRVVGDIITPHFRANDFYGGIVVGTAALMRLIEGESLPAPKAQGGLQPGGEGFAGLFIAFLVLFLVVGGVLARLLGRLLGATATSGIVGAAAWVVTGTLLAAIFFAIFAFMLTLIAGAGVATPWRWVGGRRSMGDGWSVGGGFGGGGGFSGGGGGFSGGGASGSW